MKLMTYRVQGRESFGVLDGARVVDGRALLGDQVTTIRELLVQGLTKELARRQAHAELSYALSEVEFLPPIPDPAKILCVGVNYQDHRDETGTDSKPEYPTIFTRFADTQVGHEQPVQHPANTNQLDYEGEVALVIGSRVDSRSSSEQLKAAIAGLSCYNDVSARDWQLHNSQWVPGKNFFGVGSFGPWLVTLDEIKNLDDVRLTTRVNGELRQDATLGDLIFGFEEILSYITGFTPLSPGDVIATGTPGGVGLVADPPQFLQPGDITEVEVSGVGVLRNTISPTG